MTRARCGSPRGSAAVLAVTLVGVMLVAALLVTGLGVAVVDQRRAEAAADLSALAGADAAQAGLDACQAAAGVARRNGARSDACGVHGRVVTVRVTRESRLPALTLLGRELTITATSRAGPVDSSP